MAWSFMGKAWPLPFKVVVFREALLRKRQPYEVMWKHVCARCKFCKIKLQVFPFPVVLVDRIHRNWPTYLHVRFYFQIAKIKRVSKNSKNYMSCVFLEILAMNLCCNPVYVHAQKLKWKVAHWIGWFENRQIYMY